MCLSKGLRARETAEALLAVVLQGVLFQRRPEYLALTTLQLPLNLPGTFTVPYALVKPKVTYNGPRASQTSAASSPSSYKATFGDVSFTPQVLLHRSRRRSGSRSVAFRRRKATAIRRTG